MDVSPQSWFASDVKVDCWLPEDEVKARRSRAREVALQLLFQRDGNPDVPRWAVEQFVRERLNEPEAESFCLSLYDGVVQNLSAIDSQLAAASENWKLHRMAASDRNVLRLGVYEIGFAPERTPGPVALDEAIELARRYGSADSPSFVNGVLDRIYHTLAGAAQAAPPAEAGRQ